MQASSNDNGRSGTVVGAAPGYATDEERRMPYFASRFGFRRFRSLSFVVGLLFCRFVCMSEPGNIFFLFLGRPLWPPLIKDVKDTLQIRLQQKSKSQAE
jgi:hypothetical protein